LILDVSVERNYLYSSRFYPIEFIGAGYFASYPFRVTCVGDVYHLDFPYELDQVETRIAELHAKGIKIVIYKPFSSLSEYENFMEYYNLSKEDIAPMDLNGTYFVSLPGRIGYEGREAWRNFFINYMKFLFDAGIDGVEFDGGDGFKNIGSFDPETMQKFNEYLASKYNATELQEKFNITDISSFNFTQYLIDLGYQNHTMIFEESVIAHPGIEGPQDNEYVKALWKEFEEFRLKMVLELYKLLWESVKEWEEETGRDFYISTRFGHQHFNPGLGTEENDIFVLQYVDGMNWEYCWVNYPNRTASKDFRIVQSLNKTFNPWIYPWSSLESTGFTEWFINGWNKSADPEEQYLGLAEIIVCSGRIPLSGGTNQTHFAQFIRLVQENPHLFGQSQFGEIALIYPVATAINIKKLNLTSVFGDSFDAYEGAYYLLADSHRTFDIVVLGDNIWVNMTPPLSRLLKYKAIVLSNAVCLTDDQVELLKNYLENGGIIIGIGEIATHNEYGEPVSRDFAALFDGDVHEYGNGLIVSIKNVSPSDYLLLRTLYDDTANSILETFKNIIDTYVPREVQTDLSTRAHIYRFFNYDENCLIFQIINFNYDFEADKVIRAYNVSFSLKLPPQLKDKQLSVWVYSEDYPEGVEVPYTVNGDTVSITIPKVSILTVIEVRPHFEYYEPLIINEPTIFRDETMILNRSIIVNSSLEIINSQIVIRGEVKPIKIEVLPGGSLTIINSKISKETGSYYIVARRGSHIYIDNSEISGAGLFGPLDRGGICIEAQDAVILNSKIHDNYDYGILLIEAPYAVIANNIFSSNSIGVALANSSYIVFYNNTVENNSIGVCVEGSTALDFYDFGELIKTLPKIYFGKGKVPDRGATKIDICNSYISNNKFFNIIVIDTSFVTITGVTCSGAAVANIFAYRSMIKIHNSIIHSSRIGVYIEDCPLVTLLSNEVYNNTYIGIKLYHIIYMGILRWLHLEPIAERMEFPGVVLGNKIYNNTYGLHIDTHADWNEYFRIANNTIEYNDVGMYIDNTKAYIYQNNFINNTVHVKCGKNPPRFYLISYASKFKGNQTGNYWSDYDGSGSYLVVNSSGNLIYDLYPLEEPAEISLIQDISGPLVQITNITIIRNETSGTAQVCVEFFAWDENYLASTNWKENLGLLAIVSILGPKISIENGEYGWNGYSEGCIGPDEVDYGPPIGWDAWINNSITWEHWFSPLPSEWLDGASFTVYCSDMYGNWNKNDTVPPHIAIVLRTPLIRLKGEAINIYALVSDWSQISKIQLMYSNGSSWNIVNMTYDDSTHLYHATIPPQPEGATICYKVYAEDIYGNSFLSKEQYLDMGGPTITDVSHSPQEPTSDDTVKVTANITDPSGVDSAILSYSTDLSTWYNISMNYNATSGLYEATIPAMPVDTTVYYKIYANDTLGNLANSTLYSYTVSAPTRPLTENLIFYLVGASVSIVAIAAIIFIIKRRKTL
jgi:parallel beta-helix repeat protein